MVRPPPDISARQCGVFCYRQAVSAGWTRSAIRHAVRTGAIVRLRTGAYQVADLDHLDRFERARWLHAAPAIGGVLVTPGALASHSTAAVLHELPLLFVPDQPCVTVVPWHTGELLRTHVHRCTAAPMRLPVGAVACTSVERTAFDLAREHGVVAGAVALDYLLHERLTDAAEVAAELRLCTRWPGVRAAREAVAAASPLSESPLETRSRFTMAAAGVPAPKMQVGIGELSGRFIGRVDFYWDEFGVVGEADGMEKYDGTAPLPLHAEKIRQEALEATGLIVVRWGSADLRCFEPVAERLKRAFGRGARRPATERRWQVLPPKIPDFAPVKRVSRLRWRA